MLGYRFTMKCGLANNLVIEQVVYDIFVSRGENILIHR